jgi:hypothetical protein
MTTGENRILCSYFQCRENGELNCQKSDAWRAVVPKARQTSPIEIFFMRKCRERRGRSDSFMKPQIRRYEAE